MTETANFVSPAPNQNTKQLPGSGLMAHANSPLCPNQGSGYDASPFNAKMNLFKFSSTRKNIQKSRSNLSDSSQNSLNLSKKMIKK